MTMQYTHHDPALYPADNQALVCTTRRRQRLGVLLIVVGLVWLWLRMIGWISGVPLLIRWVDGLIATMQDVATVDVQVFVSLAAYGMLPSITIHSAV